MDKKSHDELVKMLLFARRLEQHLPEDEQVFNKEGDELTKALEKIVSEGAK